MAIGCGGTGAKTAQAGACEERGRAVIEAARTCHEAVAGLERLIVTDPECAAVFGPDAGVGIACVDGGAR